jgi:GTP-binding protein LepA
VPVLNKIDLPAAEPDRIKQQIEDVIGLDASDAVLISAKTGIGIDRTCWKPSSPACRRPRATANAPLKALLVDSWYDAYLGVVVLVRIIDGVLRKGQKIKMMGTGPLRRSTASASSRPKMVDVDELGPGEVGFITASDQGSGRHPRRRHHHRRQEAASHRGPAGLQAGAAGGVLRPVPRRCRRFRGLRAAMGKLRLNDASFSYEMETRRARLRLPLRLPRPAASGNHPGAAGARVQSRPDRHRAVVVYKIDLRDGDA